MGKDRSEPSGKWRERFVLSFLIVLGSVLLVSPAGRWIGFAFGGFVAFALLLLVGAVVVSFLDDGLQRLTRSRRLRTGKVTVPDVLHYAHRRFCSTGKWQDGGSPLSFSDVRNISDAMVVVARPGRPVKMGYSPDIIYRWLRDEDQPELLIRVLRAGIPEADLRAYLNGNQTEREAFKFVLSLRLTPEEVA